MFPNVNDVVGLFTVVIVNGEFKITIVATLPLGSQPKQGITKVQAKIEAGSHISCSRKCKKM
jgi:hypothetical protein